MEIRVQSIKFNADQKLFEAIPWQDSIPFCAII